MPSAPPMTLDDLAAAAPRAAPAPVPPWAQGAFALEAVVFADGGEADSGRWVRLQGHGLVGQLRIPASRPDVSHRSGLHDCALEELLALAAVDGGVADAVWTDGALVRANPCAFQPRDAWPEPGILRRVGDSLAEFAPSGAYRIDWRLLPGSASLLVGLRLMFETGPDGKTRPRDGGLLICGDHGLFALDRRHPLPSDAPVQLQMRAAGDPLAFADMVFDGEVSYVRPGPSGDWRVQLSTNPFREGRTAPVMQGFSPTSITGVLRQQVGEGDAAVVRQWRIDTLVADSGVGPTTPCDEAGATWLKAMRGQPNP